MKQNWVWVDNPQKMQKAVEAVRTSSLMGIDTEYDSFRYFREKLCLIQIKTQKKTYLFDPFAEIDIAALRSSFSDPRILKILHAGDNDIRILSRDYGFTFNPIFDTQKAASILGCRYLSLSSVVQQFLGKELKKTKKMQRSQWESRPLTEEQILYAVQDTEHLIELYRKLREELRENGLEKTAAKAFEEEIASARWAEKVFDPRGYRRIGGYEELTRFQQKRLRTLHRWRFQKARETNTALFMILSDQNLVDLSRARVNSLASLQKEIGLSPRRLAALGPELVELLRKN